jgi:hypothetical protein
LPLAACRLPLAVHVLAIGSIVNELSKKNPLVETRLAEAENVLVNLLKYEVGVYKESVSSVLQNRSNAVGSLSFPLFANPSPHADRSRKDR